MSIRETHSDIESEPSETCTKDDAHIKTQYSTDIPSAAGILESLPSSSHGLSSHVIDHKAERALCRKLDFRLLPILAFMCRFLAN
jgi:hypothetical protein